MATQEPLVCDDAALARSLQLAADMDFAERELSRLRNCLLRRQIPVVRGLDVSPSEASSQRSEGTSLVFPRVVRGVPVRAALRPPPAFVTIDNDNTTDLRRNNSTTDLRRNNSKPKSAEQPKTKRPRKPAVLKPGKNTNHPPSIAAMLNDGSSEEESNRSLLFVPCEINDRVVEMMVDTGAQTSVVSAPLMKKLGLESRLNTRMQGMAAGVGRARILGRIENCPVQIGHVEFLLYFSVLEIDSDMMILGIDQMRRFNCLVDLEHNKLIFGGKGGVEVDFLSQCE